MKKGLFLVIDGTDGSGKGTQTNLLVEKLKKQGYDTELADFPRYGKPGAALVERYLNGDFGSSLEVGPYKASILFACDRYEASFQIKDWLNQGKIVISNRYVSSNMGHQAGKIKDLDERNKFLNWLEELEYGIFDVPKPDVNLLLYMPPEIGQQLVDKKAEREYLKGKKRDIHEADLNHLKDAAEGYLYVAKKYGWTIVDSAPNNQLLEITQVSNLIWDYVEKYLGERVKKG